MSISLDSNTHKLIVGGHLTFLEAIDSAQVQFEGDLNELAEFFSMFDPLTISTTATG